MKKILVISGSPTHPTHAGGRASLRCWVEAYRAAGIEVHLAIIRFDYGDEMAMRQAWGPDRCTFLDYEYPRRHWYDRWWLRLARLFRPHPWVPYRIDDWCGTPLLTSIRELAARLQPDCVHVEYVFFSRLLECFGPGVYKILNTNDVFAGRERLYLQYGRPPEWFFTTREEEARGVARADCIIAIQKHEGEYFKQITRQRVVTISTLVHLQSPRPPATSEPTLVFIGSDYVANVDAIKFFCTEIWPLILAALPAARLEIYGGVCRRELDVVPGTRLAGSVADLSVPYQRAWLVICPLRFGTGLKRKTIEALGWGKALVTTATGAEGLEDGRGRAFLQANAPAEFARLCLQVLSDDSLRQRLEQAAYEFATAQNEQQAARQLELMTFAGLLPVAKPVPRQILVNSAT